MHVVSHGLASLVGLVSLNEASGQWVVLFELVVAGSLIIAKNRGDSEILRTGIENNSCWLRIWRSHVDSTEINGIVSAIKRNLQLKVISVVFGGIGDLADQLSDMSTGLTSLLSLFIGVDIVATIDIIVRRVLSQGGDLFLSYLSCCLSTLHFPKLTVVHLIALEHDGLIGGWHVGTFNH